MQVTRHRSDYWIKNNNIDVSKKELFGHVDEHCHEFCEIELIMSGAGTYNIDGIGYDMAAGDLFIMSPSSFHCIDFTESTVLYNLMFVPDIGDRDALCRIFGNSPHVTLRLSEYDTGFVRMLLDDMVKNGHVPYLTSALGCLLSKILLLTPSAPLPPQDAQMKYALLYIRNHFRESITLAEAAEAAHYSKNYFGNKFRDYMGVTFGDYIASLRFSLAEKMLGRTSLPVTEICYSCGFSDYANFAHSFKKRYGMTPLEYRKKGLPH